jgi:hypothetical protein
MYSHGKAREKPKRNNPTFGGHICRSFSPPELNKESSCSSLQCLCTLGNLFDVLCLIPTFPTLTDKSAQQSWGPTVSRNTVWVFENDAGR